MTDNRSRGRSHGETFKEAVDHYLNYKLESSGSRSSMEPPLLFFEEFCRSEGIERVNEFDSSDCREFVLRLADQKRNNEIAGSTANTYFAYVRAFLSFCVRDELLDKNPADTERVEEYLPEDKPGRKNSALPQASGRNRAVILM